MTGMVHGLLIDPTARGGPFAVPALKDDRWVDPGGQYQVDWGHPLARGLWGIGCGTAQFSDRVSYVGGPSVPRSAVPSPQGAAIGPASASSDGAYRWATGIAVPDSVSLIVWANFTSTTSGLALCWNTYSDNGFGIGNDGNNCYALAGGVAHRNTSAPIVGTGWRMMAVIATQSTVTFFVDGTQVATTTGGHQLNGPSQLIVGSQTASARAFFGSVSIWSAYDRALTASEVARLYVEPLQVLRRVNRVAPSSIEQVDPQTLRTLSGRQILSGGKPIALR